VEQWPENPVNVIAKWLAKNFQKQSPCVVADFGCGDAALAQKLVGYKHKGTCPFRVHSFDLVASSDLVTACDMAHVPLPPKTVDVAVFCLSLMGTNLADFLREAHRVLKETGVLKIAEIRSRFESTDKKDELKDFVQVLDKLGFKCLKTDLSNKMFVMLECKTNGKKPKADLSYTAKPCIYKRR
jgi:ribosomal RNA-processing protein 8